MSGELGASGCHMRLPSRRKQSSKQRGGIQNSARRLDLWTTRAMTPVRDCVAWSAWAWRRAGPETFERSQEGCR